MTQAGHKRDGLPMALRHMADQSHAACAAPARPSHVGRRGGPEPSNHRRRARSLFCNAGLTANSSMAFLMAVSSSGASILPSSAAGVRTIGLPCSRRIVLRNRSVLHELNS
jgi:hypothetical protein